MKYLHLYRCIAPKDPVTGEVQGMKFSNLEAWSLGVALTIVGGLTIWAVYMILQTTHP